MTRPSDRSGRSRRSVLGATTALFALTAGCIADEGPASDSGDDTDDTDDPDTGENETDEEKDGDGEDGENGDSDAESERYETQSLTYPEMPDEPDVEIHFDRDDVEEWLADRTPSDDEAVSDFVDETSFEESVLVSLEASAPDLCHELVIDEVTVGEESIDVTARVSDESGPDEACAQQLTAVGQLVRATPTGDELSELSATIVDQDGTEHGFGMGFDSDEGTASESRSVSESGSDGDDGSDSENGSDGDSAT
ncbi:hypothetical protein ACFO5R_22515 [Halosolutus amylolyticus]|uniref:Uncharacterized protein n=1 Tax=Halosolutus amylolyticus TaxID=2932267 RepID=A0ABD5PXL7_9EURY|nr:hypothetical protein [Halosolutus amylolyticus]